METVETRLRGYRQAINASLATALPPHLHLRSQQAARAALLSPGKRIRPLLTLLVAEQLGAPVPRVLPAAVAVEMIHAASLVLDDLPCMDDAQTRRGEVALHRAYGQDIALLAVITLVNGAYGTLAAAHDASDAQQRGWARLLAEAVGPMGLVGGQERDLSGSGEPSVEDIRTLHLRKTAVLFRAAAQMGALAADADEPTLAAAGRFGEAVGLALQAFDDLADAADQAEIERGSNLLSRLDADATRAEARTRLCEAGQALGAGDRRLGDVAPYVEALLLRLTTA